MNKIGTFEIIDTRSLIIPPGDDAWLDVVAMGWSVKLNFVFEYTGSEAGIKIQPQSNHARITFSKWENSLGTATTQPVEIGTHSTGRKLYFMATHYLIGSEPSRSTIKLDVQFLMGAEA
jgi:hypothetical protein